VAAVHRRLRETVEEMVTDRYIADQIDAAAACLRELVAVAESATGQLA
jgi:histidine ammonia-lyase